MTKEQLLFILLRSLITEKPISDINKRRITESLIDGALRLARAHNIAHLIAESIRKNELAIDEESSAICDNYVTFEFLEDARHTYNLEQLKDLFNSEKLPFLPLKGAVLKRIYPQSWMRNCCDIDILVHVEDLDRAIALLTERLSYSLIRRGYHDVSLMLGGSHIELHFSLIEKGRAKRATDILENVWSLAEKDSDGYEYTMPDELLYFYHIAHIAKHITTAGCGIRNFLDTWLLNHRVEFDADKRNALLADGGLLEFAKTAERLAEVWFSDAEHTPLTQDLAGFILGCGAYGTLENRVEIARARNKNYYLSRAFPPFSMLKKAYPFLQKYPIALPYVWAKRFVTALSRSRRKRIGSEIIANAMCDQRRIAPLKRLLKELDL